MSYEDAQSVLDEIKYQLETAVEMLETIEPPQPINPSDFCNMPRPDVLEPMNGGAVAIWYSLSDAELRHLQATTSPPHDTTYNLISIRTKALRDATQC